MLTYGSVCSGIEAASVAWESLGFKALWFSEIDKFPCAVFASPLARCAKLRGYDKNSRKNSKWGHAPT